MIALGVSYQQRAYCYFALMTEGWPPFVDNRTALDSGPSGPPLPPGPAPATTAPPVSPERPASGDPLNP